VKIVFQFFNRKNPLGLKIIEHDFSNFTTSHFTSESILNNKTLPWFDKSTSSKHIAKKRNQKMDLATWL